MADPLLNENLIVTLLDMPASVDTVQHIKQGLLLAAVDSADRKILRDKMIDVMASALTLQDRLARIEIAASLHWIATNDKNGLKPEDIQKAIIEMQASAEADRLRLLTQFKEVMQCPLAADTKH